MRTARTALLFCGVLSSLVYLAFDLAALRYPGYSYTAQTISEISAIGAPSRPLAVLVGLLYDALVIAFGVGLWRSSAAKPALRTTGRLLIVIGFLGFFWPPMHQRGTQFTATDTMHIVFAAVTSLLIVLAVGFGAAAFGTRFRVYSVLTIVVMLIAGALTGTQASNIAANLPTPWAGITERIDLGAYLLWVAVLSILALRAERATTAAANTSPRRSSRGARPPTRATPSPDLPTALTGDR